MEAKAFHGAPRQSSFLKLGALMLSNNPRAIGKEAKLLHALHGATLYGTKTYLTSAAGAQCLVREPGGIAFWTSLAHSF